MCVHVPPPGTSSSRVQEDGGEEWGGEMLSPPFCSSPSLKALCQAWMWPRALQPPIPIHLSILGLCRLLFLPSHPLFLPSLHLPVSLHDTDPNTSIAFSLPPSPSRNLKPCWIRRSLSCCAFPFPSLISLVVFDPWLL